MPAVQAAKPAVRVRLRDDALSGGDGDVCGGTSAGARAFVGWRMMGG